MLRARRNVFRRVDLGSDISLYLASADAKWLMADAKFNIFKKIKSAAFTVRYSDADLLLPSVNYVCFGGRTLNLGIQTLFTI